MLEVFQNDSGTYVLLRGVLLRGFSGRELNPRTAAFSSDAFLLLFVLVLSATGARARLNILPRRQLAGDCWFVAEMRLVVENLPRFFGADF